MKTLEQRFEEKIEKKQKEIDKLKSTVEQQEADIDYIAIMSDIDLEV